VRCGSRVPPEARRRGRGHGGFRHRSKDVAQAHGGPRSTSRGRWARARPSRVSLPLQAAARSGQGLEVKVYGARDPVRMLRTSYASRMDASPARTFPLSSRRRRPLSVVCFGKLAHQPSEPAEDSSLSSAQGRVPGFVRWIASCRAARNVKIASRSPLLRPAGRCASLARGRSRDLPPRARAGMDLRPAGFSHCDKGSGSPSPGFAP